MNVFVMLGLFAVLLLVGGIAGATYLAILNDRNRGHGKHGTPHGHTSRR